MKLEILKYKFYDNTLRNVYILSPDNLEKNKKYDTLYMFDGEATFIKSEYTNSNWGVIEALETNNVDDLFVIAFDNANERRLNEYISYDIIHHGKTIESSYNDFSKFIINELIPYLESKYPLNPDKSSRSLAGSSAGAWVSMAFATDFKDVFSTYGIFSLASWVSLMSNSFDFIEYLDQNGLDKNSKYFIYVGDKEGYSSEYDVETKKVTDSYLNESKKLIKYFEDNNFKSFKFIIGEDETHSELSWKKYMKDFIEYLKN